MIEFTTFLITIAAIAATIAAIVGGFVFSRYIDSINERRTSKKRKDQMNKNLEEKLKKKMELQQKQDENKVVAALDIIRCYKNDLIENNEINLTDVYFKNSSNQPVLSQIEMTNFWTTAKEVRDKCFSISLKEMWTLNEDNIPKTLAELYSNDNIKYKICHEIFAAILFRRDPYNYVTVYDQLPNSIFDKSYESIYYENMTEIDKLTSSIDSLELKIEEEAIRIDSSLNKLEGALPATIIFAYIAVFCIICPLIVSICEIKEGAYQDWEIVFISLLSFGILLIFIYFTYMLRRGRRTKEDSSFNDGLESINTNDDK